MKQSKIIKYKKLFSKNNLFFAYLQSRSGKRWKKANEKYDDRPKSFAEKLQEYLQYDRREI